jgi:hypothetical protein
MYSPWLLYSKYAMQKHLSVRNGPKNISSRKSKTTLPNALKNRKANSLKLARVNNKKGITKSNTNNNRVGFVSSEDIPLIISKSIKMKSPLTMDLGSGDLGLTHQELITTVHTSKSVQIVGGFNLIKIHVNPGLKSSFPWLNSLAVNYLNYQFTSLSLVYVPRNTVTVPGSVMVFAEYDPSASDPENRQDFLNRKNAQENQVFKQLVFKCSSDDLVKEKAHYIRVGAPSKSQDIKLLDCATLYFAYEGVTPDINIGDLFWQYSIALITPNLHLGRNLISKIESTLGRTASPNSATDALPLGIVTAANFIGNFAGALLSTATGGLSGQFFSTGKTILKFIQGYFPPAIGGPPNNVDLQVLVKKEDIDNNVEIIYKNEDDQNILSIAAGEFDETALLKDFTDITVTNSLVLSSALDGSSNVRLINWGVSLPAHSIFRFKASSTGNPSRGYPSIIIGDLNMNTLGLLPDPVDIQYN